MRTLSKEEFFKRYDIDIRNGRLGGGAFGTVYKAYDNLKDEWKAVKIAEVKILNGKEFSLISEFAATESLTIHKNIINYESVHKFQMPNGIFDYAIMQYYPHGNLKQLVKAEKLESHHKVELIEGLLKGLKFLHSNGIIHRDIKPSNILIAERKGHFTPKIADFGLSKNMDNSDISAVTNSFGGGTLEYSSPEQLLGHDLRFNTDLWAIGVIAYELFIGQIPFNAKDLSGSAEAKRRTIYQNIVNAPIPPDIDLCPRPYDKIIQLCLIKDPSERIKSADEALHIIKSYKEAPQVQHQEYLDEATLLIGLEDDSNLDPPISSTALAQETLPPLEEEKVFEDPEINQPSSKEEKVPSKNEDVLELVVDEVQSDIEAGKSVSEIENEPSQNELKENKKEFPILDQHLAEKSTSDEIKELEEPEKKIKILVESEVGKSSKEKKRPILIKIKNHKKGSKRTIRNDVPASHNGKRFFQNNKKNLILALVLMLLTYGSFSIYQNLSTRQESTNQLDRTTSIIENENPSGLNIESIDLDDVGTLVELEEIATQFSSLRETKEYKSNYNRLYSSEEKTSWVSAQKTNTIDSYGEYLESFEKGNHVEEANNALQKIFQASEDNSNNRETDFYNKAFASKSKSALLQYLSIYPEGKFVSNAQKEIRKIDNLKESKDWDITISKNTILAYQSFTDKYPKSTRIKEATTLKNEILKQEEKDKSKQREEIEKRRATLESEGLLKQAEAKNDPVLFQKVVDQFPESDAAKRAKAALIKSESKKENLDEEKGNKEEARIELLSSMEAQMINIPSGTFVLGCIEDCDDDNRSTARVNVNSFSLSKYEVSQEEYEAIMGSNPSTFDDCKNCPVENVSYYDIQKFISKLNNLSGQSYRLPSEVEWEYAAKSGQERKFSGSNDLFNVGVYRSNSNNGTQKVGSKKANNFGLFDMSGNVYEWTDSPYSKGGYGDDKETTNEKVVRGGSWRSKSGSCRVVNRGRSIPSIKNGWTGFRLAMDRQ